MLMVREAWEDVSGETIKHCWDHTKIQPIHTSTTPNSAAVSISTSTHPMPACPLITKGWEIMRAFASTPMGLPEAESRLQAVLGARYIDEDWRPALKAEYEQTLPLWNLPSRTIPEFLLKDVLSRLKRQKQHYWLLLISYILEGVSLELPCHIGLRVVMTRLLRWSAIRLQFRRAEQWMSKLTMNWMTMIGKKRTRCQKCQPKV
ncbi:hypothetical protein BDQ12DRAFT_688578 [Crucibulum laeve]|uniref:Uncharacterized protein n=1 Tax=Crucibulum laeve TaxID=68775 RepID=A0A5C3LQQ7_9AGAR|nr:hypothetical protein BDQ12DRAFT_688578 [Crucibulum laeve]